MNSRVRLGNYEFPASSVFKAILSNQRYFNLIERVLRSRSKKFAITSQGKTTTLHKHHAFLYISLSSTARLPVKMPNFTFCDGRKQAMTNFILFMNLDMFNRNSAPEEFAWIGQGKRVGIITIETEKM